MGVIVGRIWEGWGPDSGIRVPDKGEKKEHGGGTCINLRSGGQSRSGVRLNSRFRSCRLLWP